VTDLEQFLPERVLRALGYNKILGKTKPPQTLYWHCLSTFYASRTLSSVLPRPLNAVERRVLGWAALLHDAGKGAPCWQERGRGPHTLDASFEGRIKEVLSNDAITSGFGPKSDDEMNLVLELIREHHTRRTLSDANVERILSILRIADNVVSAKRIDSGIVDSVARFLQPRWRPLVLTAEEHPVSYYALGEADIEAEKDAVLLITNPLQSMYLLKEGQDPVEFKTRILATAERRLSISHKGQPTLARIYSWISAGPIRDVGVFLEKVHAEKDRVVEEIFKELDAREARIERHKKHGEDIDERELWFGPFRILYHATRIIKPNARFLIGTSIEVESLKKPGSPTQEKDAAQEVAKRLGCGTPRKFAEYVIDLIRANTVAPQAASVTLDVLRWSDEPVDATALANRAYAHYVESQWNSRTRKRDTRNYCFSCKRRKATKPAPSGRLPTDTWTSSVAEKGKVYVCDLCFTAQAWILPEKEPGKFHLDATPAYNLARVNWDRVFWEGLATPDFVPQRVSSHRILFQLNAETPNEALVNALGYPLEFQFGTSKEYRSYADLLFLHGLHGTVGAGPQHPGSLMLTGCGIHIDYSDWERYGAFMKMFKETHPQDVFPVNLYWSKITSKLAHDQWSWGTLLALRHRRGALRKRHAGIVEELIKMKSGESGTRVLESLRALPLHVADRDERFKSAESVFRRMERATMTASKHEDEYGEDDVEIVARIAELGKKQLRARIMKNSKSGKWNVSDERLAGIDEALRAMAREMWRLRDRHSARGDFINAAIMTLAYNPRKEEE